MFKRLVLTKKGREIFYPAIIFKKKSFHSFSMANFVIVYPELKGEKVKEAYEHLKLSEGETHLLVLTDGLKEKEVNQKVEWLNGNISYSCMMNTCLEKDILQSVQYMSGVEGDALYFLKKKGVAKEIVNFSAKSI